MKQPKKLKDEAAWQKWQDNNKDAYGNACIRVAREAMLELDAGKSFEAYSLITEADNRAKTGGITGEMAGYVASMISQCHERGEEFRKSWNKETQIGDISGYIKYRLTNNPLTY
jgi:hypothetical protein